MKPSSVPVFLFIALALSIAAALPLAGTPFVVIALVGFPVSLAGLAWWVLRADAAADPRARLVRAADRWEEGWDTFERDFWAHVRASETSTLD
jgi:hypothetical protein